MEANTRNLRERLLVGAALTAVGLFLGAPPALAQLSSLHGRCANVMGNVDEAIAACSFLIQSGMDRGRNLAISHYNRGISWVRKGDHDRAIDDFTQAIRIDPAYARAYNARGSEYEKNNELERALAEFNRAIELDPTFAPAYNNRGFTFARKGEFDRAIADAGTAIRLDANYARAYGTRGNAYARKGEFELALSDLSHAIRLDPTLAPAYNDRGIVYRKRGDIGRALSDFNEAIRLDPAFAAAYNNRALVRRDQRGFSEAISDLDRAIRINPRYALAYVNRGSVYEQQGDNQKALADFNAALSIEPNRRDALAARSRIVAMFNAPRPSAPGRMRASAPALQANGQPPAADSGHLAAAKPSPPATAAVPQQPTSTPETKGAVEATKPAAPARTFAEALSACDKNIEHGAQLSIAAPDGTGKIAIPACYKGRRHLECTMNALLEEAAAIDREYGEIVRENYPARKDVKAICSIPASQLDEHLARSKTFDNRATRLQQVFEANATCIESVRVAIGEINLGAMRDPGALMSSLLQYVGEPVAKASAQQREVMRLVGQIDASRKAMATVQELRRIACPSGFAAK